ncbi:MAG TPA: GTP cyclohydrolase, FolE2/MptA family, partial [Candidatus Berkiella sp.]|nr:GTP cyclohydrolase, FolE2/MptA family [Candidatus Berkiella sp.]
FVEILNEKECILSIANMPSHLTAMVTRLHADDGYLRVKFPYFVTKYAPISKAASLMNYDVSLQGILEKGKMDVFATVVVPVTSLCPCSKEISDYGAHNQRSHVTVTVRATPELSLREIIQLVESKASCELFGILKRADEKAVTERAYDNPRFVEDTVRDIAASLEKISTIKGYKISSE